MSNDDFNPLTTAGGPPTEGGALSTELGEDGLPGAGAATFDPLAGATGARKLNGSVILLTAVVLIAAAGLFSMKKLADAWASNGIDRGVEATIDEFLQSEVGKRVMGEEAGETTQEVVRVLNQTYSESHVPLRDVQRDPFVIERETPVAVAGTDPDPTPVEDPKAHCEFRRQQLQGAAHRLEIKACMQGSLAIVNGATVRLGETIEVAASDAVFEVIAISRDSITVRTEDEVCEFEILEEVFIQR